MTSSLLGSGGATDALSSLGGDLTFAISWAVANELLAAARDAQLGEAELVGVVLFSSICLSALPKALLLTRVETSRAIAIYYNQDPPSYASVKVSSSGLFAFLGVFLRISQRISLSVCVQLLTANVQATQPLRAVRVLTMLGTAVFFLFLESTATLGRVESRSAQ